LPVSSPLLIHFKCSVHTTASYRLVLTFCVQFKSKKNLMLWSFRFFVFAFALLAYFVINKCAKCYHL
jgi:hypothetical protein